MVLDSLLGLPVDHRMGFAGSLLERIGALFKLAPFSDSTVTVRGHSDRQRTPDTREWTHITAYQVAGVVDCLSRPRLRHVSICTCAGKKGAARSASVPLLGATISNSPDLSGAVVVLSSCVIFVQSLHICRILKPALVSLFNRPTRFCAGNGPHFLSEAQTSP